MRDHAWHLEPLPPQSTKAAAGKAPGLLWGVPTLPGLLDALKVRALSYPLGCPGTEGEGVHWDSAMYQAWFYLDCSWIAVN